jgi:ferrous iron transport protein B
VALIGPPNSGKTTVFNQLTGLRQKVANFPGVTVEQHTGVVVLPGGDSVTVIDLPGVYSLEPRAEDEQVTHDVLTGRHEGTPKPDAILLVLDSTNLGRHLVLAGSILSLGMPTLIILNMADDLRRRGGALDVMALSKQLGAPVVLTSARRGEGIDQVRAFLGNALPAPSPKELPVVHDIPQCRRWAGRLGDDAGYRAPAPPKWTRRLDAVALHPVLGIVLFLVVVVAVFQCIFNWVTPWMDGEKWLFEISGNWLANKVPATLAGSLLIDGIWKGIGSVLVFLPQVLVLFLFMGILEDSGYLARAAVIADRTMARAGLQGKSFIPLLSAYACAVPAVMSTRTIENRRDRMATILVAPFITCSARMPIYTLVIAAFVPNRNLLGPFLSSQTAVMLGLYGLGLTAAVATARLLKSSILKTEPTPFLLEMPAYRWPTLRSLALRLADRAKVFLHRAGTIILFVTVLVWAASHVPFHDGHPPAIENSVAGAVGRFIEPAIRPLGFNWKIGIGLITSLAARETIVATLGSIYSIDPESHASGLQHALRQDMTTGGAVALLIFFAFAMQCTSTLAVVRRETGSWKWPLLQFCYMGILAYLGALLAVHLIA